MPATASDAAETLGTTAVPPPPKAPTNAKLKEVHRRAARAYAETATSAILAGKDIPGAHSNEVARRQRIALSEENRERVAKILGPDIDRFRAEFADMLLAIARDTAAAIWRDLDEQKPETRAFTLCALVDKSEALRGRLASAPRSAGVTVQVNIGADPSVRAALIQSLSSNTQIDFASDGAKSGALPPPAGPALDVTATPPAVEPVAPPPPVIPPA